jgi:hypothetical protein
LSESLRQLGSLEGLRDPVLILGFAVRQRGGRLAHEALLQLVKAWQAERVAEIDGDDFIDYTVRRPQRRYPDDKLTIEWPQIDIYLARPPGANRDFILAGGFEPHFRWPLLTRMIAEHMDAAGVRTVVSLRSFPGSVPHTRPAPVNLTASDIELEVQFGIQAETSKYEGPADFAATIGAQGEALRWKTVELSVIVPYYFRPMPSASASISLIKVLDHAFGTETSLVALTAAAAEDARVIEENLSSDEARAMIEELEHTYDEGLERGAFLAGGDTESETEGEKLPPGEDFVRDVERFFREGGSAGPPKEE